MVFFYGFVNYVVEGGSSLEMEIIKATGEPYFPVALPLCWEMCFYFSGKSNPYWLKVLGGSLLRNNLIIKIKIEMVLNCQALSNKAIYILRCRSWKIFLRLRKGLCIRLCSSSLKRKKRAASTSRKSKTRASLFRTHACKKTGEQWTN